MEFLRIERLPPDVPEPHRAMGSTACSKFLLQEAKVGVSPGIGFGEYGNEHVRFAFIENAHRTRRTLRGIRQARGASDVSVAHG